MYAKHGNLVECRRGRIWRQIPTQNTWNHVSRLEVIQGHAFWDH